MLKKDHNFGCYTEIQVAMGFCRAKWCDFVVYFFKRIIIVRIPYDYAYYKKVLQQLDDFYFKWYLPQLMGRKEDKDHPTENHW